MRILLITTTYPTPTLPRQGAFNRVLVEAVRARHDVRVIAPVPWTKSPTSRERESEFGTLHPRYYYPPRILRTHYHHFYWHSIRSALIRLEKDFRPEIVLGYWLHPDGAAAVRAAKKYGVPSMVMSGGSDLRLLTRHGPRRRAVVSVLENADRLIVFSRELATQAQLLGVPPNKIDVLYRGVNRLCFYPQDQAKARQACRLPEESVVIFWAGRFDPVKNPEMLVRAAVAWKRKWGQRLRLVMAGDGPLRKQLQRLRRQLGLEDCLEFAGNLTQCQLAQYFNASDLTVLTSHSEGIPNVLLESIACGTPFVATDVGGVGEIATPGMDRLVTAKDEHALAIAVIEQLQTPRSSQRSFVPTDLTGMADQLDSALARLAAPYDMPTSVALPTRKQSNFPAWQTAATRAAASLSEHPLR